MQLRMSAVLRSLVLLLALAPVATSWACFPDVNNRIAVSPSGSCNDIQTAIDFADGFNLLTVDVMAGDYVLSKPLMLKSNVELLGAGYANTALHSTRRLIHLIEVKNTESVTVSGFNLNAGGILVKESNNVTISQNTVGDTKYGLLAYTLIGLTVRDNIFNRNEFGLVIDDTESLYIDNNIISAGVSPRRDGMLLSQNTATITNNTIEGNVEAGIEFGYGDYTITNNTISIDDCTAVSIEINETNSNLIPSTNTIAANTTTCG